MTRCRRQRLRRRSVGIVFADQKWTWPRGQLYNSERSLINLWRDRAMFNTYQGPTEMGRRFHFTIGLTVLTLGYSATVLALRYLVG